ncbi:interferon-inducible GTPase 5-like [Zootoca vivipara]|uniref:interferon-inducible GTPase 5-like n=1 Tax=Zootoca vivipara TaxID=8524 RepID=UPI00293B9857|nr:interferon-inducible GTPase 5-like [Zootoca vivipara]
MAPSHHHLHKLQPPERPQIEDLKRAFEKGSFSDLSTKLQDALRSLENICLDVGVAGEPGAGKSTFINTFRELHEEDEGAAPTRGPGSSNDPVPYSHPKYANVVLWNLPSISAPGFSVETYLEEIKVSRYDCFIILASQRFTSAHAELSRHINKAGKDVYFVLSKVDAELEAARQSQPSGFSEAVALQKIREACVQDLQAEQVKAPKVFLVSSVVASKYDFPLLGESLCETQDVQKSHSFILATPNISHRILEKKKAAMVEHMWLVSAVACGQQAVPIPALSIACNVDLLAKTLQGYCVSFGLDESSLRKAAEHAGQPLEQLKALVKSPVAVAITDEEVVELLMEAASKALKLPRELVPEVPVAEVGPSFTVVYNMLKIFVDEAAADAHRVLLKAFMSHRPRSESDQHVVSPGGSGGIFSPRDTETLMS